MIIISDGNTKLLKKQNSKNLVSEERISRCQLLNVRICTSRSIPFPKRAIFKGKYFTALSFEKGFDIKEANVSNKVTCLYKTGGKLACPNR